MMQMQNQMGSVHITPQQQPQQGQQPLIHSQTPQYYNATSMNGSQYSNNTPQQPTPLVQAGFYRDHAPVMQQPNQPAMMPSSPMATGQQQQPPQSAPTTPSRYYTPTTPVPNAVATSSTPYQQRQQHHPQQPTLTPNLQAGMHNIHPGLGLPVAAPALTPPSPVTNCMYQEIVVTHPLLVQGTASLFGFKQAPHWSYQLTTKLEGAVQVWMVRRRFRHVVALEDRLRQECPGAILPPRLVFG